MQALLLMAVYILTTISVQAVGFLISRLVDLQFPQFSVMAFIVLFISAFGIAWPIAVAVAEWLIRYSGHQIERADPNAT